MPQLKLSKVFYNSFGSFGYYGWYIPSNDYSNTSGRSSKPSHHSSNTTNVKVPSQSHASSSGVHVPPQDHFKANSTVTQSKKQLIQLGIPDAQAQKLAKRLSKDNDQLYYGGQLKNGKIYIITNKDKIFYGKPDQLKQLTVQSTRPRCMDSHGERTYKTKEGFTFKVRRQNEQKIGTVSKTYLFGLFSKQQKQVKTVNFQFDNKSTQSSK